MAKKKILFVEDNQDNALLITEELGLGESGGEVVLMNDGQEAMDYFNKADGVSCSMERTQVGLVLLDLNLPKVDGLSVLKFLKRDPKYRSIPVIILTTSSDQETIDEAYKYGTDFFMTKAIFFEERYVKVLSCFKGLIYSIVSGSSTDKINIENRLMAKLKALMEDFTKDSRKMVDINCEILNESLNPFRENNMSKGPPSDI